MPLDPLVRKLLKNVFIDLPIVSFPSIVIRAWIKPVPELVEAGEPLSPDVVRGDVAQALPAQAGDGDAGLEPVVPLPEAVLAVYLDVGAAPSSGLGLLAAEDLDEERSLEEKGHWEIVSGLYPFMGCVVGGRFIW